MKASCPRCGRGTEIDSEAGDFPVRCQKCGALLRRNGKRDAEPAIENFSDGVRRIERGALAGLLVARASDELSPAIIHGYTGAATAPSADATGAAGSDATATAEAPPPILRPESRKEIARAAARQKALRQATLRASLQSFSALSWAGATLIVLLLLSALALKAQSAWRHPAPAHADTLSVNP